MASITLSLLVAACHVVCCWSSVAWRNRSLIRCGLSSRGLYSSRANIWWIWGKPLKARTNSGLPAKKVQKALQWICLSRPLSPCIGTILNLVNRPSASRGNPSGLLSLATGDPVWAIVLWTASMASRLPCSTTWAGGEAIFTSCAPTPAQISYVLLNVRTWLGLSSNL